ncbi:MAG TPA: RidA family protein, partial [Nocardioidaceae bacterium]|nr:RidA family protein [Nocardioidaceae bacterium]
MSHERINPDGLAPATGFSHAVRTTGTTVHLAGQTALDAEGRIVGDGIVEQFEKAFGNLLAALDAAGGTPDRLASLTIYLVDVEAYKANAREIGRVWKRLAGAVYPATA